MDPLLGSFSKLGFLIMPYSRSRIFAFISHVFHYIAVFNFSNRISADFLVSTDFSTVSSCPTQLFQVQISILTFSCFVRTRGGNLNWTFAPSGPKNPAQSHPRRGHHRAP